MPASLSAGQTVLAPNSELAANVSDAVERHHLECGRALWPTPRIRDFGSWLREQHLRRQLSDAAAPRALSEFEELELWRGVVAEGDWGEEFLDPTAAAAAARRAYRAIHQHGIPRRAIAAYGTEESRVLLRWIERFEERCRELGCVSNDELLASFAAAPEPVVWLESPAWRPVPRRWLEHHAQGMIPPAAAPARDSVRLCHAASPEAELAAAADWARGRLRSHAGFRAWIAVPDLNARRDELADAFDAALAPQRFGLAAAEGTARYALAGGSPLAEYAPIRAALATLSVTIGQVPFERFSAMLRSPELQASEAEAGAAALLDIELRSRAPSELPLRDWLALSEGSAARAGTGPVAAVMRLKDTLKTLEALRGSHALSRWVPVWIAAFEQGPWSGRHRWSSGEYQSAERFRELLSSLASADRLFGTRSRRAADHLLASAARDTPFQPRTGIPAIWITGQIIDPWLVYDGIWIAGVSEQRWPPPLAPLPLLPVPLQRDYGVAGADASMQLRFAADLQERWLARAPINVFSIADGGEARLTVASPLLPAQIQPLQPEDAVPRPHWRYHLEHAPVLERVTDDCAPPFGAGERTRGVATLRSQSLCAFRGYAETRLQSDRLDRPLPGFDARERGILVHEALQRIWSSLGTSAALQSIAAEERARLIRDSVTEALEVVCARRDPGKRWHRRERRRLQALLEQWLAVESQRDPFEVERLEQGKQAVRHAGVEFSCRIDRVDRLADGDRVLIDYKTGLDGADWRGDRPANPQLPVYALAQRERLVAVAYARVNAGGCRFVAESERSGVFAPHAGSTKLEGMANFAQLLDLWAQRIERLASEFGVGRAEVAPAPGACRYCHLPGLCRISELPADDGAAPLDR